MPLESTSLSLYIFDVIALISFLVCWAGYAFFADYSHKDRNLVQEMYKHRLQWMEEMIKRPGVDRLIDVRVVGNLMHSVSFFASTSIFIIAGSVTLMGYSEKAIQMLAKLPFTSSTNEILWEVKTLLLVFVFTYAFFKHTWALRLFNYSSIFMVSTPKDSNGKGLSAIKLAQVLSNAARHFNMGIRAYYFGMASLGWFIHPILFLIANIWVVIVLYRREYLSRTLAALTDRS